jgi:aryl-alcohol dehydrogenase-like predicted oxidoreductase
VKGCGALHPETGVDQWAAATLSFEGDLVAQLATGVGLAMDNQVVVFGAEGRITVPSPWVVSREGGRSVILVERQGQPPREIAVETSEWLYGLEADTVARHLAARQAPAPAMSWEDSLGNMRTLDRWRQEIGLVYRAERPEALVRPVARRPLARRAPPGVPRRSVPGLALEVSRLVVGLDNTVDLRHWTAMLDALYESGVNCFDTAWIYAGGQLERLLGHWLRTRGVRDDVAVIVKGAHTPCCNPEDLSRQLVESLGRIGTDRADLYFMHRDNPQVPAGEFVDCLNRHVREGRVRVFGGSNWSLARVDEANAYARRQGLQGFGALSNNFSLARMVKPVWAGCIAASDADSRAWFERTQTPLFAWSSQARGFFTRGDPAYRADASLAECWYSDDNFRRLERTRRLARERGVEPLHVALAYVLAQPFPVFPLIGPRSLGEFRSSQRALAVELTERDRRWLNLETD